MDKRDTHVDDYLRAISGLDRASVQSDPYWANQLWSEEDKQKLITGWSSAYYELPEGATELADLIDHKEMNFNVGNIFKAAYRLGNKHGTTAQYDLEKIIWYASRELKRVSGE